MNEIQEAHSADAEVRDETFTWEVWEADSDDDGLPVLTYLGEFQSESAYSALSWSGDTEGLQRIGRIARRSGNFTLIHEDRIERVSIVAETVYRRAEEAS